MDLQQSIDIELDQLFRKYFIDRHKDENGQYSNTFVLTLGAGYTLSAIEKRRRVEFLLSKIESKSKDKAVQLREVINNNIYMSSHREMLNEVRRLKFRLLHVLHFANKDSKAYSSDVLELIFKDQKPEELLLDIEKLKRFEPKTASEAQNLTMRDFIEDMAQQPFFSESTKTAFSALLAYLNVAIRNQEISRLRGELQESKASDLSNESHLKNIEKIMCDLVSLEGIPEKEKEKLRSMLKLLDDLKQASSKLDVLLISKKINDLMNLEQDEQDEVKELKPSEKRKKAYEVVNKVGFKKIVDFLKREKIDIADITPGMLENYEDKQFLNSPYNVCGVLAMTAYLNENGIFDDLDIKDYEAMEMHLREYFQEKNLKIDSPEAQVKAVNIVNLKSKVPRSYIWDDIQFMKKNAKLIQRLNNKILFS